LEAFGLGVLQRILCYALYLLGLNRRAIGQRLNIPPETAKSIIKAISKEGLAALEDRRRSSSTFLPQVPAPPPPITLREEEEHIVVDMGIQGRSITLSRKDPLQLKTVLLSMVNSGLLSTQQVAKAIALTPSYTAALARRLQDKGALSLVDQRQGQKQDYRVPPSVKAELIQQFAVDVITRGRTSSSALSEELQKRCRIAVPDRTIRHHVSRLGLGEITRSLPQLVAALKKSSSNGSRP
jgi:transposase